LEGTVLLVEDNPDVLEVSIALLEQLGYRVRPTDNAASALQVLASGEPVDVVFSDIVMPGEQNGLDLARAVRREHGTRVPVLLATGYSDVAQVAAAEGFRILRKPYSTQQLRDALDETLRATRLWVVV
jgi:two-component system NtrC family sensor kinase